ncbi:MAG: DUF1634 domain-containing protein [Bryobacteraceae bacterium]
MQRPSLTDREVDDIIGLLLRFGVILSASVVGIGGIWYLIQYGTAVPDYHVFRGEPKDLRSIRAIVESVRASNCYSLIQLGLILLIATPVARVAFSVVAFFLERDRAYVIITLIVLSVLMFSLFGKH